MRFVTPAIALQWHDANQLKELIKGQKVVSLITCRDIAQEFAVKFGVETVMWIPITVEANSASNTQLNYSHYPLRMNELLKHINPIFKGHLFLVGAGILGKIYCRVIKERGGIALDLGSVFDNWAVHTKRRSVKRHRVGF